MADLKTAGGFVAALIAKMMGSDWKVTLTRTAQDKHGNPVQYALKVEGQGRERNAIIPASYIDNQDQEAIRTAIMEPSTQETVCLDEEPPQAPKQTWRQKLFGGS